jgi:hypothetical protein
MLALLEPAFVLTQRHDEIPAGAIGVILAVACGAIVIVYAILAVICWYLSGCLKAIPDEHRKQQPNMVWLMMIPLFNIVWIFFVYPKIAESYKSYFDSIGRTDVGDCGRGLSLAYCILTCASCIPYLNFCTGLPTLVIWIIVLVKFGTLKGQIQNPQSSFPPAGPTA